MRTWRGRGYRMRIDDLVDASILLGHAPIVDEEPAPRTSTLRGVEADEEGAAELGGLSR